MSKVPKVQEIFSNPALGKNNAFVFTEQETKQQIQLSKKKAASGNGQMPIMKKFGGYKPKILGGETDFLALRKDDTLDALNQESRTNRLLTKPQPWIIGDKNVPMVLAPLHDDDDDYTDENGNNHENGYDDKPKNGGLYSMSYSSEDRVNDIGHSLRTHSISSETSTLISNHSSEHIQGFDNPGLRAHSSMSDTMSTDTPEVITGNPNFTDRRSQGQEEIDGEIQEGVYIPAPDYDEEERTLDFNSEDTDDPDSNEESKKSKELKAKPLGKVYGGEDLSHYLTDDEVDENQVELRSNRKSQKGSSSLGRKSNSDHQGAKLSQKHSLFKQQSQQSKNKRNSGKVVSPGFNSVRSFSYADSKFGTTKNKSGSKHNLSFSELTDDSETFLNTNTHQSSYESFLRSRNGDAIPNTDLNDSGVEMGEDGTLSHRKSKDDTLWKKMTLRLKHTISKKGSAVKEH